LTFYDPTKDVSTPILPDWQVNSFFSVSTNNRLAFSSSHDGSNRVYVLDYPFTNTVPINIANESSDRYERLTWSPDGNYLAYVSTQANGATLFIWNGESNIPIHHSPESISEITWSQDGRLAFTVFYTFVSPYEGDHTEIFIWDGKTTTSLSQNPTGDDRFPIWNKDGQVAFLSERAGDYDIFIWDGISKVNGIADINTFINVAPHLTLYTSFPVWTNSGSLSFGGLDSQIYEWDGQDIANISLNPDFHNSGQLFCNRTVSGKSLIFPKWDIPQIVKEYSGWTLSMWNGRKIIDIAQGSEIEAAWPNGKNIFCSSG
jgi:dipeptidyl aminopeptidase/acylaminoacyl peptidase